MIQATHGRTIESSLAEALPMPLCLAISNAAFSQRLHRQLCRQCGGKARPANGNRGMGTHLGWWRYPPSRFGRRRRQQFSYMQIMKSPTDVNAPRPVVGRGHYSLV